MHSRMPVDVIKIILVIGGSFVLYFVIGSVGTPEIRPWNVEVFIYN